MEISENFLIKDVMAILLIYVQKCRFIIRVSMTNIKVTGDI